MQKFLLLAALSIVFLCGCPKGGDLPSPGPAPGYVPSAEMQTLVTDIKSVSDLELAGFYRDFADVIERDSEIIKTTGHLRDANMRAGQLMFQGTGMKGKYPGLAEKIDSALETGLGKKNAALNKSRAVEVFRALAWACE